MNHRNRWSHIVAVLSLGLAVMCTTARAQVFSTPPTNVSNNSDFSFTPQVAVDLSGNIYSGNIYVVWEDDTANSNILFSRSTDGGTTFSTPKNLSNSSGFSFNPRIALDAKGNINVVWEDDTPGNPDVFFTRSTDGGATFFPKPVNLSLLPLSNYPADYTDPPQIAVDTSGNINVVWKSDIPLGIFIVFTRSADGGATFSTPVIVSNNPTGSSITPQIAVDKNGNINVVWEDDIAGHSDISFNRSADNGATFPALKSLSRNIGNSNSPQIAVDLGGNINVVWENDSPGHFDIFSSRSTDNGATFSPIPKNLSNGLGGSNSNRPQIALDAGGNINVVWEENTGNNTDIFFTHSSNGGLNFSAPLPISKDPDSSSNAWLTVDSSGNINVAWEDTTVGNGDIFFARSVDGGTTFSPTPQNLSNDAGLSLAEQVAVDKNGNINVVWQDRTPGPSQILFSRASGGGSANQPPTIMTPPANQTVAVGQTATFSVTASGTAPLSYQWQNNGVDISGATSASYTTPAATTQDNGAQFRVVVSNSVGSATSNAATLTVDSPPVADAGADQTIECAGHGGTPVRLDGSKSSDPNGDALGFVWKDEANNVVGRSAIVELTLTMGTHTFTLTVTDLGGLSSRATTHVTVQDTAPPTLWVSLSPNVLWPPNHKLVQVTATVDASDACGSNTAVVLVSITSNDQDHGRGHGNRENDIQAVGGGPVPFGTDVRSFMLRAEYSGKGTKLIYTVTYMAKNASGHTALATAQVRVGKARSDDDDDEKHEHSRRKR